MSESLSAERSRNYLRQIKGAVLYKIVAMAASFLTIPLMIRYLGQEQFGVWSTLLTVMSWIVFFDLGIGNGLRNKVAESLARNERIEAARYIASGYTLIGLIALVMLSLITTVSFFIPWQIVFNTLAIHESDLRLTVQIAMFFIAMNFWAGIITVLLGAIQKSSQASLGQLITNILVLLWVILLSKTTDTSISYLALVYGLSMLIANVVLSILFYRDFPELRPHPYLNKKHIQPLLSVGLQFFIIQLAVLLIFTTDKILITQLFGPQYVTQYDVVFKLFSVITFAHTLVSSPLWSAYTDAYHRGDLVWIKHMLRKQLLIFSGVVLSIILLVLLAKPIIGIWIGHRLHISTSLIIMMGMFVMITTWNNIYAMLVNGMGKIRVQLYTAIIAMLTNIPLSVLFSKYLGLGLSGIVLGTICSLLFSAIALPIQTRYILRS